MDKSFESLFNWVPYYKGAKDISKSLVLFFLFKGQLNFIPPIIARLSSPAEWICLGGGEQVKIANGKSRMSNFNFFILKKKTLSKICCWYKLPIYIICKLKRYKISFFITVVYIVVSYYCIITELCPTLCDLMDCSPPGSSVRGISQARIREWLPFPSP